MEKLQKANILASKPTASANLALAFNVREQVLAEQEEAKIKEEEKQEAALVASLNDGSYFEASSDESSAGDVPEERAESEEVSEEAAPEAVPVLASDDSGLPDIDYSALIGLDGNRGFVWNQPELPETPPTEEAERPKTIKQKFFAVMDWLTEDQARLTVVLTVFCMSVYLIVKLVKK